MESKKETNANEASTSGTCTSTDIRSDSATTEHAEQMWEDTDNCILCDKPMETSKSCVVKKRGIENLIVASIKRKDGKNRELKKYDEITIHKTCQLMYVREKNIKLALKELSDKWHKDRSRSASGRNFDFSKNCFLCSNIIYLSREKCSRMTQQSTIDNIIAQLNVYPKTEINKTIISRLVTLKDKHDDYYIENNVSYHSNCLAKFYGYSASTIQGRPISESMSNLVTFIINYIVENSAECQFSLKAILEEYIRIHGQTDFPRLDGIEKSLVDHFGDEIICHSTAHDRLICFKRTLGKCLEDNWYSNRSDNVKADKLRIVDMAAHIILQDIRSIKFDVENYNSPIDFLKNVTEDIPETLKLFLDILIKTHKRPSKNESWEKWDKKIVTAAHILMNSVRPRSFSSHILLGLSCMMHTKFGARGLIDCLCNLGLCASYSETVRLEDSIANDPENYKLISDPYLQFIYDNADHNTGTIDGKNTFHCMGGIMCVTPESSVQFNRTVPRLKGVVSADTSGTYGFLPLTDFQNKKPFKLDTVTVRNWRENSCINFSTKIEPIDLLYFYGKHSIPQKTANWHGFMNKFHTFNKNFFLSKVIALPFIKAPPSDHSTILTALIDARHKANTNQQKHCFVTFDLPLYMKASEIIASIESDNDPHNLVSVIPRLGGFHLLMSFLGSIGNIMAGSGIKEAFCTLYAELSADKALSGHAFSRSVRGHMLVQAALATIIFKNVELTDAETTFMNESLEQIGAENCENCLVDPLMIDIKNKFVSVVDNLHNNGPTSQLWLQYFKLICLIQRFIDAERSGNFNLHLQTVQSMIPFFFASGHHLYGKASLLYVQKMLDLKNIMDIFEYDRFCNQGFHTIRRSNRFWSGIWTDMTIEQVLMRSMKCTGGLTHGRGLTENVIGKWVLSRVAVLEVENTMEIFSNANFSTSEQHVDNRVSRISRDADDLKKLQDFFNLYNPFLESDKLIGIFSGITADLATVNCHKAFEIGKIIMDDASNKKFTDLKYKKNSKIVNLAAANSFMKKVANEDVYISPLLIFQKISLNIKNEDDIKEYASMYELAPIPLSLFDENGMRKTNKSAFYSNFNFSNEITATGTLTYVIDGGFFLHKIVWQSNSKIEDIINQYVTYAKRHYTQNSYFVFDGYPDDTTSSTKSVERSRRHFQNIGREITFDNNTIITTNQKQFLSNEKNKCRLINIMCTSLNRSGFRTKIAVEDADRLIVTTAIENARADSEAIVIIVGEDVDLLVIFSQLATSNQNIFFRKDGKASKPHQFYSNNSFKYDNLQPIIAFLHAFCGCDTVSAFYRFGKNKLIETFSTNSTKLINLASVFYNKNASCEEISRSAYELVLGMYSTKAEKKLIEKCTSFSLSDLRYLHFCKAKVKTKFALETLPPTEGAIKQHAFRVFYQVQLWLGNTDLTATDWGWLLKNNRLIPLGSADPPIPKKLLDQISCSCTKKGCIDGSCGCRKHGLKCTNLCAHCHEDSCYNLDYNNQELHSDEDNYFDNECNDEVDTYINSNVPIEMPAKRRKM